MISGGQDVTQTVAASFRDPGGRVFSRNGRIFRIVGQSFVPDLKSFLASPSAARYLREGKVVSTRILGPGEVRDLLRADGLGQLYDSVGGELVLEHERIFFPSFPYEWPPEMLHAAGRLTLDLARTSLADGLGLKDATPYNLLFRGPDPVFVDVLSFERRRPADPVWLPYAQFQRNVLLPLLANRYFGWPVDQVLLTRREGLEPEDVYRMSGPLRRLLPPFLTLSTLPTWLAAGQNSDDAGLYGRKSVEDPEKAAFILQMLFRRLDRQLKRLAPARKTSRWTGYMAHKNHYSGADFRAKSDFVRQALEDYRPGKVLDVGCNTGHFSVLAARSGAQVVAMDQDPAVVGDVWRTARSEQLAILPLINHFGRPTPATGWRNRECASFLDRARGAFDAVLMLAVLHHVLVNERVPLDDVLDQAAEWTTRILILEFVAPDDVMFRRIVRGREHLFTDLTRERFEAACRRQFRIVRSLNLDRTSRWLYVLEKQ